MYWMLFFGNEYFKYVIDSKVDMKLSVEAREKLISSKKNFGHHFLSLNCMHTSVGVPFDYRKSLEKIRRMRNVTIYNFRQVHL